MRKRLLSALLAMAMVLTMLPMSAFAAGETDPLADLEVTEIGFFSDAENFKSYINGTYYLNDGAGVQDVAPNTVFVRMNKAIPEGYGLYMWSLAKKGDTSLGGNTRTIVSPNSFAYYANDSYAEATVIAMQIGVYPLDESIEDGTMYNPDSWSQIRWLTESEGWKILGDDPVSGTKKLDVIINTTKAAAPATITVTETGLAAEAKGTIAWTNATEAADKVTAKIGAPVSFTVAPPTDYTVASVKVNNEVKEAAEGKYSFVADEDTTVAVTYQAKGGEDDKAISEVAITLKTDGLKAGDALPNAAVGADAHVAVATKWLNESDEEVTGGTFPAAGTYKAEVTVTPADGYTLAAGAKYTLNTDAEKKDLTNGKATISVTVAAADPQTQKVTSVKITMDQEVNVNGTLPEVKVVTVPANAVDVSISGWKKGTDTVEADNVTKEAGTYTATFAVTERSNFELAADTAYEVNGVPADKDHLTANLKVKVVEPGSVIAAPLVDQANNVTSDKLVDAGSYEVKKGTGAQANTIFVKATGLKQHNSAGAGMGYWVGVGIPKVVGDTYAVGRGVAPAVANMKFGAKNDSEYNGYVTFYFNAGTINGGAGADKDLPKNGYIAVKGAAQDAQPVVYVVDLSGVKIAQPEIQAVGFETAGDDANKAINDLTKEMRGKDGTVSDAERDTMFVALNGLDSTAGYKVVVKNGTTTLLTKTLDAGHKTETVFYFTLNKWTGSTGEDSLEGKLTAGDYTIELQKADGTKIVGETITLKEVTMKANGGTFGAKVGTDGKDPYAEKIANGVLKMMVNSTVTNTDLDAKVPTVTKAHNTFVKWNWTENTATAQWTPAEIKTVTVAAQNADNEEVGSLTAKVEDGAIKISGLLPEAAKKIVVSYTMSDNEDGTPKNITVAITDGKLTIGDADKKLTIDSGKEYGVDVSGITVSEVKLADPAPVVDVDKIAAKDQVTVSDAVKETNIEEINDLVSSPEQAKAIDTAAKAVTAEDKAEAKTELKKLAAAGVTEADEIAIVAQPVMQVKAESYDAAKGVLKLDISAGYRLVAVKAGADLTTVKVKGDTGIEDNQATAVEVAPAKTLENVTEAVNISVNLPAAIAKPGTGAALTKIAVLHEKNGDHYHTATITADATDSDNVIYTATFTSTDGLSPFTFDASANLVAEVNGKSYTSLADAINAAGNNDVVTLLDGIKETGAAEAKDIKFDADKNITFKLGGTLDAAVEIKVNDATINVTTDAAGVAHKFEKNTGNGGGMGPIGGGASGSTTYSVNVPTTEHGTVTVNPRNASKDATVTITVSPNQGYILDTLTVTDKDGNNIELTKVDSNKYTFKMPASRVEIKASFKEGTAPADGGFTDITSGEYYYDAVLWAVDKGITTGLTETTFGPNASCTRAQMVTFLWRAAGSPEPTATTTAFTDVDSNEYYYKAMLWAVEKGITKGTTDTTFAPNATVTRAQTVTFLYRYAGSPAVNGTNAFTDLEANEYYVDAVQWAATNGITTGTTETTFSPANNCTRGQIVTFLYRHLVK